MEVCISKYGDCYCSAGLRSPCEERCLLPRGGKENATRMESHVIHCLYPMAGRSNNMYSIPCCYLRYSRFRSLATMYESLICHIHNIYTLRGSKYQQVYMRRNKQHNHNIGAVDKKKRRRIGRLRIKEKEGGKNRRIERHHRFKKRSPESRAISPLLFQTQKGTSSDRNRRNSVAVKKQPKVSTMMRYQTRNEES